MLKQLRIRLMTCTSLAFAIVNATTPMAFAATPGPNDNNTTTPIKHVIVIVGENRTFDHLFATYVPPAGNVKNLLSEGIVNADGTPGPNVANAEQYQAADRTSYTISPNVKQPYSAGANGVPPIMTGGAPEVASDTNPAPFATLAVAEATDYGLEKSPVNDYVELTTGATGLPQPVPFTNQTTGEGSTSMGFYNVQQGDVPYFKSLADEYAIGDNYHQPVKGGTGADSVELGFAAPVYYQDANGNPATPPSNQIENPNPQAGTNNWYTQDGYSGGTYSNCADSSQPGVANILDYLKKLPYKVSKVCAANTYYLLNNYNPGYNGDGTPATLGPNDFTIPPQHQRSIANTLDEHGVSWAYYGEYWNTFVQNPNSGTGYAYCNICNPFLYQSYVMTNATERKTHMKDTTDLYADLKGGVLPAVSWVKPSGFNDGHPSSSKYDIFEAFVKKIVDAVEANPALAGNTAIMITNDEGGGYYDSGFEQTLDFFGDGTRIPMIVVSPYSKGVGVVHSYGDHASFIKFVNANWGLPPIASNTRDNLPNPVQNGVNPYVPTNMPAIDDLMSYFKFPGSSAKN